MFFHRFSHGGEQQMVKFEVKSRHVVWSGNLQSVSRSCSRRAGLNENKVKLCQVLKLRTYRRNNPIPSAFVLLLHLHALGSITFRFILFVSFLFFLSQAESDLLCFFSLNESVTEETVKEAIL